ADRLPNGLFIHRSCTHGKRLDGGPLFGITWHLSAEHVLERSRRSVTPSEGIAQVPHLAQGGDERGVTILLVVDRARFDPGRDDDRRDPVAGTVERESELAFG